MQEFPWTLAHNSPCLQKHVSKYARDRPLVSRFSTSHNPDRGKTIVPLLEVVDECDSCPRVKVEASRNYQTVMSHVLVMVSNDVYLRGRVNEKRGELEESAEKEPRAMVDCASLGSRTLMRLRRQRSPCGK